MTVRALVPGGEPVGVDCRPVGVLESTGSFSEVVGASVEVGVPGVPIVVVVAGVEPVPFEAVLLVDSWDPSSRSFTTTTVPARRSLTRTTYRPQLENEWWSRTVFDSPPSTSTRSTSFN